MLFNIRYITLAALFAVVVSQQPPQCALDCGQAALGSVTNSSCKSITDPCICADIGFQTADGECMSAKCTLDEQKVAGQLQNTFCGAVYTTGTGTFGTKTDDSASSMSMTKGSGTGTSSGSTASTTTKNAASAQAELGFFTLGVAAAGAVVGGLLL